MLQRNPHPYALVVPDIPAEVQPGETTDWPRPIVGFEPVADDAAPLPPEPAPSKRKAAAPAPTGEEPTP
ncbi:hypothetical protein [Kitasatospora sp. NBC_01302]|uniref:hypothetical protein n=1 Tax=Kitasatospora sp. NBC_01302 TaxID=2903575 RepID=UPI002E0F3CAE|nr:hypothetical protein OG294_14410 [Kitasatospora sp. NBC_01302]